MSHHTSDDAGESMVRSTGSTVSVVRAALFAGAVLATAGCANEPLRGPTTFTPIMVLSAVSANAAEAEPASADLTPINDISKKSLAAKVLASRALESVTGLKTDPARLSEHD